MSVGRKGSLIVVGVNASKFISLLRFKTLPVGRREASCLRLTCGVCLSKAGVLSGSDHEHHVG